MIGRALSWLAAAALFAAVAVGGVAIYLLDRFDRPGPLAAERVVQIPQGAGLAEIARRLEAEGVIEDALVFRIVLSVRRQGRALKAGEYGFAAGDSMGGVAERLIAGRSLLHPLTLPEGLTSHEIVALVEAAEGLEGPAGPPPPEGSLLPETYLFSRGDGRAAIIGRMREAATAALAELWAARDDDLPLKSPEEALILASIVEKETGVAAERPLVASVFINRLRRGMRLQSDPTVVYGLTEGKQPLGRALTRKDLEKPTAYNTYVIDGLPPGPIANPGRASLEAVVHPAESDYFYFVASGDGGHRFAATLEEHNRNVAKWRKHQRQNKAN